MRLNLTRLAWEFYRPILIAGAIMLVTGLGVGWLIWG